MNTQAWIQIILCVFAISCGSLVLPGIFRQSVRRKYTVRFLEFSLLASLAGLLPLTRRLTSLQAICILSVYCSGVVVLALLKFRLTGKWGSVFAFLIPAVLYLDIVALTIRIFPYAPVFVRTAVQSHANVYVAQILFALFFAFLGIAAARRCHPEPARLSKNCSTRTRFVH
jgi:hypothetical protein